jgi:acyl carrier protein
MDAQEVWTRLTDVFRSQFDDPRLAIAPETSARDVPGWDSLAHIQLLVAVEIEFGIKLNTGEVAGLANVGEMVALIVRRTAGRAVGSHAAAATGS